MVVNPYFSLIQSENVSLPKQWSNKSKEFQRRNMTETAQIAGGCQPVHADTEWLIFGKAEALPITSYALK